MSSTRIFADDTPLPVLDPGRGRTKTGRLWGYAVDDRPWNGRPRRRWSTSTPRTARASARPRTWPTSRASCRSTATAGFKSLLEDRPAGPDPARVLLGALPEALLRDPPGHRLAAWRRRRCAGSASSTPIEAEIRGRPAEERRAARQERSKPIVDALHAWLTAQLERVSGKSSLAEAIRYALRHWQGLVLFLEDGRLELDTNTIERAIRPIALGRKNSLFAGSDGGARHWAIVASLVATAKLNGVEPLAWLTDVLERMVSGRTKAHELERLLPWTWKAERLAAAVDA